MRTIYHLLDIATPRESVFDALTTGAGLSSWWTTQARVDRAVVGGHVQVSFRGPFNPRLLIVDLRSPSRLVWEGVEGHDSWGDTVISFDLAASAEGTRLAFRHRMGPDVPDDIRASANFNWGYYLNSLRLHCETGTGRPFPVGSPGARVGADPVG
jgi:uncharacterized protein YndB with AHSA1/START domain